MRIRMAFLASVLLAGSALALAPQQVQATQSHGAVFTLTNSAVRGNEVVAYERRQNGALRLLGTFPTGGRGSGPAPTSSVFGAPIPATADGLGSQESLVLSPGRRFLFAVNAGSNSITCFRVNRDGPGPLLRNARTVDSGGTFPVSLTFRATDGGGLLFVLNSGDTGNITGFRVAANCALTRVANGQSGPLNALVDDPPFPDPEPNEVLTTPGQVGFTPDGRKLVVTIKGGPQAGETGLPEGAIAVFDVNSNGRLIGSPRVTPFDRDEGTAGPFSFIFDHDGNLLVNHANSFTFAAYRVQATGALRPIGDPVPISALGDGSILAFGSFNCWVARRGNTVYVMSIGDLPVTNGGLPDGPGVISALTVDNGRLELLPVVNGGAQGVVAILPQDDRDEWDLGEDGTFGNHGIDLAVVRDGNRAFLYAIEPRLGQIGAWEIRPNGTLRFIRNFDGQIKEGVDPFAGTNPGINDFVERCFLTSGSERAPECRDGSAQGITGF